MQKLKPWINGALGAVLIAGLVACRQPSTGPASAVRHVDAPGAVEVIGESGTVVLDVRTPEEYGQGHLPGAINIDYHSSDFQSRLATLDRESTYLVYCRSGYRSSKTLRVLDKLRFQSVAHLDGGINTWNKAGQSVER
jgi:rhodanese-related sulfurtransferase